ncbi:MAG: hypothetical protein HN820_00510 [Candidatus Marinimicrobia bacterium]|jgi:hypothetical protein|nr:hypothetical protein [Candidatus Neomarinimicrobiota bacterium]|tara:strand:+ start:264 stop:521 length:258 start_codon:yes stop_codon:yes gene_type:complete
MADSNNAIVIKKENEGRLAWRKLLVPVVGSAAFFASMLVSIIGTYNTHGWPKNAFKPSDYLLMSIPLIVIISAVTEEVNGDLNKE